MVPGEYCGAMVCCPSCGHRCLSSIFNFDVCPFFGGKFPRFWVGGYWGGVYYEWWASYVMVFISAAALSVALWIFWYVNVYIPTTLPLAPSGSWLNAARISNLSGALFIVLIIPACYGVYRRQGNSLDQGKKRITTALQSLSHRDFQRQTISRD